MKFIEDQTPTKLRGGYYTPVPVADYLSHWLLEHRPERILEPSCGDGVFFAALERYCATSEVVAFEIDPFEAAKAKGVLESCCHINGSVTTGDFLEWAFGNLGKETYFDAVIGNPPFVRYQYLSARQQALSKAIFDRFGLSFTLHTNLWVPFVLASLALLRPGGHLAMVIPAEILHVLHAGSLRRYLLAECAEILIIDPEELIFSEALQGAVLLTLRKKTNSEADASKGVAIVSCFNRSFLKSSLSTVKESAVYHKPTSLSGKWMECLLTKSERAILENCRDNDRIEIFSSIADVDVGIVTGANDFFLVNDETVEKFRLNLRTMPMFGRSDHVKGLIYDTAQHRSNSNAKLPTNFLHFDVGGIDELTSSERSYIEIGEKEGIHLRYKCRIRNPWFKVPSVYSTPISLLKRSHEVPRLVLNQIGALTTDTAYRVRPKGTINSTALVFNFFNSLTSLSSEIEGRHYGGGVLELVPSEIERLMIPTAGSVSGKELRDLHQLFKKYRGSLTSLILKQDERVLRPILKRNSDLESIQNARSRLSARRMRKTLAPK